MIGLLVLVLVSFFDKHSERRHLFFFYFFYAHVFTIGSVDMNLYSVKGLRCNMTRNTTALHFKPFR